MARIAVGGFHHETNTFTPGHTDFAYFTVQRDAMDIDRLKTPALYLGTTTGQLWIGREGGERWECLFKSLPPIHNVKVAVV